MGYWHGATEEITENSLNLTTFKFHSVKADYMEHINFTARPPTAFKILLSVTYICIIIIFIANRGDSRISAKHAGLGFNKKVEVP